MIKLILSLGAVVGLCWIVWWVGPLSLDAAIGAMVAFGVTAAIMLVMVLFSHAPSENHYHTHNNHLHWHGEDLPQVRSGQKRLEARR